MATTMIPAGSSRVPTWAGVLLVVLAACTPPSMVREHPDLAVRCASIQRVAVVPPHVQMALVRLGGSPQGLHEQMPRIAGELVDAVRTELLRDGFTPAAVPSNAGASVESNDLFRDAEIAALYSRIRAEMSKPVGSPGTRHDIECALGEDAKDIARYAGSDALIFVDFSGWKRSGGSIATEMVIKVLLSMGGGFAPRDPTGFGQLDVAMVDGRTGDVLWTNRVARTEYALRPTDFEGDELREMTGEAFRDFPKGPLNKSHPGSVHDR